MLDEICKKASDLVEAGRPILDKKDNLVRVQRHSTEAAALSKHINESYQAWYHAALLLVRANLSTSTVAEFEELHAGARRKLGEVPGVTDMYYREWLDNFDQALSSQIGIVGAIPGYIEAKALSLRGIIARDLMDDELVIARYLSEQGYLREAGVIAGIVLEKHLKLMCERRGIALEKKAMLGEVNNKLRASYRDDSDYRRVQWMSEIRALCTHDKGSLPDPDRLNQLLLAVKDFIATVS